MFGLRHQLLMLLLAVGCAWTTRAAADDSAALLVQSFEQGSKAHSVQQLSVAIDLCRTALEGNLTDTEVEYAHKLLAWQLTRRGRLALETTSDGDDQRRLDAVADFSEAINLDESYVNARLARSAVNQRLGRWAAACDDLRAAVRIAPEDPVVLRAVAWLLATAPDEQLRDEGLAIDASDKAVKLGRERDFRSLDVAAAAQANAGNFTEAAKLGHRAYQMSRQSAPPAEQAAIRRRVELYHHQQAFRQATVKTVEPPTDPNPVSLEPEAVASQPAENKRVRR